MRSGEKPVWVTILVAVSGILAFIVDLVSFLSIFGVNVIIAPTTGAKPPRPQTLVLTPHVHLELVTFILWLYSFIALLIITFVVLNSWSKEHLNYPVWANLSMILAWSLAPTLFPVWLYGFGYLPTWLYIFLVPTMMFAGLVWYMAWGPAFFEFAAAKSNGGQVNSVGCIVLILSVAPALVWVQSGYDLRFIWIIVITFLSLLIGGLIGGILPVLASGS